MGSQFGGEVVDYEQGLSFVTFHGSGHMVPQFRPQAALHFLNQFIEGQALSPLLPTNATLAGFSNLEFQKAIDGWTEAAMKCPYVTPDIIGDQKSERTKDFKSNGIEAFD
jgi:cathepsin A (carboxypeptidase C)